LELRTEDVLSNEHQLMLNQLSFELAERQRLTTPYHMSLTPLILVFRLDQKKKELTQQKEALLKESKTKIATMESVKTQIDMLMKVRDAILSICFHA